jgi:sugar (pentulose or hexulose) kinase
LNPTTTALSTRPHERRNPGRLPRPGSRFLKPAELARCFDSLALLYADVLSELAPSRQPFSQLHIVGGGCQNALLNQLCADACGITVVAGPLRPPRSAISAFS